MRTKLAALFTAFAMIACSLPAQATEPTATHTELPPTETALPTSTFTPQSTATATLTLTPTITFTPSITPTPTFAFPSVTVNKQAHCRYGPSVAFLHAADLYPGDIGTVRGRYEYSSWLYIKFEKLDYFCWVAPSVVDVVGDVSNILNKELDLLSIGYNQYGPPSNVNASRNGDEVTITWDQVQMTKDKDRGYLIIAFVCQDGLYLWWTYSYPEQYNTSYTVRDEPGCPLPSEGVIYTVEKHGFSKPATIPWPAP